MILNRVPQSQLLPQCQDALTQRNYNYDRISHIFSQLSVI